MPAAMIDTSGAYTLETNTIQFEGDFKESLKLLYAIEQKTGLSKIVSLNFEVKEDLSNQKRKLHYGLFSKYLSAMNKTIVFALMMLTLSSPVNPFLEKDISKIAPKLLAPQNEDTVVSGSVSLWWKKLNLLRLLDYRWCSQF
ncbi:MAG: hypothetical protein IPN22_11145 [Bacteroidetes bacterium]|nr:hypothetical protein [Bacteroidota bacterium]